MALDLEVFERALTNLARRVTVEVDTWRTAGNLALRHEEYTLRPDFSLWYDGDPTIMNFELQTLQEEDWYWKDVEAFLTERVMISREYTDVIRLVQESGKNDGLVRSFVSRIAHETGKTGSSDVERHVETLLRDIADRPQTYHIKLFVMGITLTDNVIQVSDSLVFRRPTREDVQEKVRSEAVHYAHAMRQGRIHFSCIVECQLLASRPIDEQIYVDRLITALRLFRLGSVSTARYDYHAESFSPFASGSFGSGPRAARLAYELALADAPRLATLLEVLMPSLPSQYALPAVKPDYLSTALRWYGEALLAGGPVEGTVAWAVACLEALFLRDNPPSELSYRLTQRVIALLRCFDWPPLEMRGTLKTAYDVRSKYLHGAVSKRLPHEKLLELFRVVAEYARVSCAVWTQAHVAGNDNDILRMLEDALIDADAQGRLQLWCDGIDFARRPSLIQAK